MEGVRENVEQLLALCLQRISMEEDNATVELEMLRLARSFEETRRKWFLTEMELRKCKELLVKSDVGKASLEVKLKHTRNQLDLEMKKRFKLEGEHQYLKRQMQLMCDILVQDTKSSSCLNDEQKSLLAAFEPKGPKGHNGTTLQRSSRRLSLIDESSFLSDISYDRTEDEVLDVVDLLDTTMIKPLRSRARERRRSSMGPVGKFGNVSTDRLERKVNPPVLLKQHGAFQTEAEERSTNGPEVVTMVIPAMESPESVSPAAADQTSVWVPEETLLQSGGETETFLTHEFVSKTVLMPETCVPCGKRVRFGRMALKCRRCRAVAHPECKHKVAASCSAAATATTPAPNSLEALAPLTHPRIPALIVECVTEIERRGLKERGLYRVPGGERQVKELRERWGKAPLQLNKVPDVHAVGGLLKDVLRKLKEPLLTFRLHRTFMDAAELADGDSRAAVIYQAIAELPTANRDTLAFLMVHLHKVTMSPLCQMNQSNLSRVFGPTIVGHGMPEPCPSTILRDTNTQGKVVARLLSLPLTYWKGVLAVHSAALTQEPQPDRLFQPLTSPELRSRRSVRGATSSIAEPGRKFFTSPSY